MNNNLQKTDLYRSNEMSRDFEGDCFTVDISELTIATDKDRFKLLDEICIKESLFPIGDGWRKVDYEHCKKLLQAALSTDLAYDSPRLGKKKAQKLMKIMLDKIAPENTHCFTNWIDDPWKESGGRSWNGITKNTIDIAIVIMNSGKLIFMYAISED